jgi:hypothetical protein
MGYYTPLQRYLAVTDFAGFINFPTLMGSVYLVNAGTEPVWFTFDGTPVAAMGNGQTVLPSFGVFNWDKAYFQSIGFVCAAGKTTDVQLIATQAPS